MTHNQWEQEMKALEADLVYDSHKYQSGQYYTGTINLYPVYIIIVIISFSWVRSSMEVSPEVCKEF